MDVAITCPLQHKYVVDAAQTLGFSCNNYADEVKSKHFESRVQEEDALYLPAVIESFGGFSRDLPEFFNKLIKSVSLSIDTLMTQKVLLANISMKQLLVL